MSIIKLNARILAFFLMSLCYFSVFSQERPNVLFILADDLGYGDLACYGHPFIQSPNLDKLAKEGIRLSNFYAPSPLCSPSRAAMLTGRTPYRTGIKSWIPQDQNIQLQKKEVSIASILKANGYQTLLSGKWHLNGGLEVTKHTQPQDHGFDHWLSNHAFAIPHHKNPTNFYRNGEALGETEGFAAQIVVDEAIQWMEQRDPSKPFFAFVSFNEPHSEIASPDRFNKKYQKFTRGVPNPDDLYDRGPGEYYANVHHMDFQIGRLLKKLKQLKLEENTLVIFTSDNGPVTLEWRYWWEVNMYGRTGGLRGRKADLFEGGIRVPAIVRFPGRINPGSESAIPVHGYDLLPTICAILGIAPKLPNPIDGIDFSPVFSGQAIERVKPLFWIFETRPNDNPEGYAIALRDDHWKLITDLAFEKTLLYNLKDDPYEVRELSANQPEKLQILLAQAKEMYEAVMKDEGF